MTDGQRQLLAFSEDGSLFVGSLVILDKWQRTQRPLSFNQPSPSVPTNRLWGLQAGLSTWEVEVADKVTGVLTLTAHLRRSQLQISRTFTLKGVGDLKLKLDQL
jgi:hypothetical protein